MYHVDITMGSYPILIICFNNHKYVENTINQLLKINKDLEHVIQIIDNCSTCTQTIDYLANTTCKVVHRSENRGPRISPYDNVDIYNEMPDKFVLTDPDLQFNELLPSNFIDILVEISEKYHSYRTGLALDISDYDKMIPGVYFRGKTICEWEQTFWENKINDELYWADIDTTFCLINKNNLGSRDIRVAGNFTAKHIPWYKTNPVYNIYEQVLLQKYATHVSTTSSIILGYIENNFSKLQKHNEHFFIDNHRYASNFHFWKNIYATWEQEKFDVFNRYLSQDKIFIDIGAWIGTTSMYGSRKSKHVYSVEADSQSVSEFEYNMKNNCSANYTLVNRAIYNIDNIDVKFGKNKFLNGSKMNDSTSQIYSENESSDEFYNVTTISLERLIEKYAINPNDVSLIKVDIEGGEEFIFQHLYDIKMRYHIPLYISFHHSWWKNKNLDRFPFLSDQQKNEIYHNPFISILFV